MLRHIRSSSSGGVDINELEKNKTHNGGLDIKKDKKRSKTKNFIIEYLIDYSSNSNLHGFKYIGEKERTFVEKIFWLFMVICCIVLCAGLIKKVYNKWNDSPVIVSFGESSTPVWQIPYPAVTVCFETKAMQTKFNYTKYYHLYRSQKDNMTQEEQEMFEDVSMVCDDHLAPPNGRKFSSGARTVDNLISVSPNMTDFFFGCKWKDIPSDTNCIDLFSPIITEEGVCFTFNTISANELFRLNNMHQEFQYLKSNTINTTWSLENGYLASTPIETYPHRGTGYGVKAALSVLLRAKQVDFDYICRGPVQGFKILLHNPAELPRLSQQYFRSPLSHDMVVAVKPKMMVTSDGLKPYPPKTRQCFFPRERYLRYFKVYTQSNCEMECLSNFTAIRCGCVHFGMPHGPEIKSCNAGSMQCIKKAQMELVTVEIQNNLEHAAEENDTMTEARQVAVRCDCLPACTSIEYEAESSVAAYDWKALFRANNLNITAENEDVIYSKVVIFFKEPQFITYRRSELYGQTDFLANCGGLLGLFMGFSILSVAEIFYFLTLRLCCVLWRKRMAKKQENTNKDQKLDKSFYIE